MVTVIVKGRTARAFSDDAITVESRGIPVRFVFSDEWKDLDKTARFISDEAEVAVHLTEDACDLPAAVLTASGKVRMGVLGTGAGVHMPSTWTEVIVVKGVTREDLTTLQAMAGKDE